MIKVLIIGLIVMVGILSEIFDISDIITFFLCTILLAIFMIVCNIE